MRCSALPLALRWRVLAARTRHLHLQVEVVAAAAAAAAGQLQDLSCGWATALQPGSGVELFWTDHTSLPASL